MREAKKKTKKRKKKKKNNNKNTKKNTKNHTSKLRPFHLKNSTTTQVKSSTTKENQTLK